LGYPELKASGIWTDQNGGSKLAGSLAADDALRRRIARGDGAVLFLGFGIFEGLEGPGL